MLNFFEIKNFLVQKIKRKKFLWNFIEYVQGTSFLLYYYVFYKYKLIKSKTSISEINIELASYCNLRCKFCSLDHEKPKIRMTADILKQFLENILEDKHFRSVKTIHLFNGGEVLLHPKFEEFLGIIKHYKLKAQARNIKFPYITLLTNAIALTEKNSQKLIRSEIINSIRFSMDGGSKEKFEEIRIGAKWNDFVKNITVFCELNKKSLMPMKTGIITLIEYEKKLNTKWMSEEFKKLLNMVDDYELRYAHNWGGDIEVEELKNKKSFKTSCSLLMNQLVLLPNGDITVCCADLNSKGVIGNITKERLIDICYSPIRVEMLSKFVKGKKSDIDLCKNCETF